ncbi:unnamed protein product [Vitrella brassicaformis CCMP3155]|uniref:Sugar transporter SWEET1 n=2 Tax=Vitrella brassicaformis TaxID=1169539 RepID=A0A0G4EKW0_VITBC|nr:unnamed protein product [Vitrella brassicaformis CCMP3155]|mmetsp:Transcript_33240/g.82276  ORF Transcript_33240/g.82276 Transcript_33240/m.82276 type:complete len:133 (+) Transcript_33240:134-532(+)|eukprot:CEL97454.1 unnamed protein product [Vitrella brassicaformis CCMP3155]
MAVDTPVSEAFGYVGSILLFLVFLPQVWLTYRSRKADGISLLMIVLEVLASCSFITYGILIHEWPVIIANASALLCALLLLTAKIIYSKPSLPSGDSRVFMLDSQPDVLKGIPHSQSMASQATTASGVSEEP